MIASYRLQLTADFGFDRAARVIPYLRRLGISHLYLSPITEAREGSTHGYDVVDHNALRAEFGGMEGWKRLLAAAKEAGLEIILDFVPNHAGVGPHNEAWQSVLAHGEHSPFGQHFDIDWTPLEESLTGKVLLPFLGQPYGQALDQGEIAIVWEEGAFRAAYGDQRFALCYASYADLLAEAMRRYERTDIYFDLKELMEGFAAIAPEEVSRGEMFQVRLRALAEKVDWAPALAEFTGQKLHELLEKQNWRLAYWQTASYETNYRRFFDVNGLVALRMQRDDVFAATHRLLASILSSSDAIAGVRIDHIDGLFDPRAYLIRLRELGPRRIWVEKILAAGETLPEEWPVDGTTGYEFIHDVMSVLIDDEGREAIVRGYMRFIADNDTFEETVRESKLLVMETSLASELFRLAYELNRLCKADYHTRDFGLGALREALAELIAALDRYRTYLPYDDETGRKVIEQATLVAQRRTPAFEPSLYEFIAKVIVGDVPEHLSRKQRDWSARFQQYTSAVAAKGVEDTAFYRYVPLGALNEVGCGPERREQPLQAFHSHARFRARRYPLNLLATATHDHKRGEDTRMRMLALAEIPTMWEETLRALSQLGGEYCGSQGPHRGDQYLFYQTLAGQWAGASRESLPQRMWDYMLKASRESKRRTSWSHPREAYEEGLKTFVHGTLADERLPAILDPLAAELARRGYRHSLSQLVLKMTSPGIPDFYQGCELGDLSLVDPDNRRPVDFERRAALLQQLEGLLARPRIEEVQSLIEKDQESAKLYVAAQLLRIRRRRENLFQQGGYRELVTEGLTPGRWLAFARETDSEASITIVPRSPAASDEANSEKAPQTILHLDEKYSGQTWREGLTGAMLRGAAIDLSKLPLPWAVLVGRE